MLSEANIQAMEEIVAEHAGPMGKFVIRKAITDLGCEPENFDEEYLDKFITLVLERSIFDPAKWKSVRMEIVEAWENTGKTPSLTVP